MRLVRSVVLSATCVAVAAGVLAVGGPAIADDRGCATRAEFRRVSDGMSTERVRNIIDSAGHKTAGGEILGGGVKWQERWYVKCSTDLSGVKYARINYLKQSDTWRVVSKEW